MVVKGSSVCLLFYPDYTHLLVGHCNSFCFIHLSRALAGNFERHKQLAKFTFPLWLYVAVTGVVVYLMISPYYK